MSERSAEGGFTFPCVADADQSVARAFGASCTFHACFVDGDRRLRYQGRFDDSRIEGRVTSHDLRDALDDVLAGLAVRQPTTPAVRLLAGARQMIALTPDAAPVAKGHWPLARIRRPRTTIAAGSLFAFAVVHAVHAAIAVAAPAAVGFVCSIPH